MTKERKPGTDEKQSCPDRITQQHSDWFIRRFVLSLVACFALSGTCFSLRGATLPAGFTEVPVATDYPVQLQCMISTTVLADNGAKFRCVVTNAFSTVTSSEATLTVLVDPPSPVLQIEQSTDHLIAFDSVTKLPDPFLLTTPINFSLENRTRIMVFAFNADLLTGENASAVTAQVEDAQLRVFSVPAEFVGPMTIPNLNGLTEIVFRIPDGLTGTSGDVFVSITLRGKISNKVRFRMR